MNKKRKWTIGIIAALALLAGAAALVYCGGLDGLIGDMSPVVMMLPFLAFGAVLNAEGIEDAAKGHQALFFSELEKRGDPEELALAMQVDSSNEQETYNFLGQWPGMKKFVDERQHEKIEGSKLTIVNESWESTIDLTEKDIKFDRLNLLKPWIEDSALVPGRHKSELLCALLNNGFSDVCYDGKTFFATNHPIFGGGVNVNKTTKKLTAAEYGKGRAALRKMKGSKGAKLGVKPTHLIVASNLEETGLEILTGTRYTDGKDNVWRGTAKLMVLDNLEDDRWALADLSRGLKPLILQKVPALGIKEIQNLIAWIKGEIRFMVDFSKFADTKKISYCLDGDYNAGYGLYQLIYGSTGESS